MKVKKELCANVMASEDLARSEAEGVLNSAPFSDLQPSFAANITPRTLCLLVSVFCSAREPEVARVEFGRKKLQN